MKESVHIQVQAVLYKNKPEELAQALQAAEAAAEAAKTAGCRVTLRWGDATGEPLFTKQTWTQFTVDLRAFGKASYQFFGKNTGYGGGNNLLAEESEDDFLLIMNPEILLPPDGILSLLSVFQNPDAGIAEARQIPVEHPKVFDPVTLETEWASGACFMIPGPLFRELGGFDTKTFFMYCEDVDLSWRVREKEKKVFYQPAVGVYHPRRLNSAGENQASVTEQNHTVLSEALLAYKWSYPEYARERVRLAEALGMPGGREAREIFLQRENEGTLPECRDPEHRIAHITQFPENGGLVFTGHRYWL